MIVDYLTAYKDRFGIEPICRGAHRARDADRPEHLLRALQAPVSATELADAHAANSLVVLYRRNRRVYGVRKLLYTARRAGLPWARDQVGRLMAIAVHRRGAPRSSSEGDHDPGANRAAAPRPM